MPLSLSLDATKRSDCSITMEKTIGNNKIGFKDEEFCLSKVKLGGREKFWMDSLPCLQK